MATDTELDDCATDEEDGEYGKLVPLADRIVVMLDTLPGERRKGKIIIIEEQKKPQFGTVIDIGPDVNTEVIDGVRQTKEEGPMVTPGDRICFGRYSGVEVEIGGDTFHLIRETDVLAVVER